MRRMWKWAKRLAIALVVGGIVVLAFVLASVALLDTDRGREWARPRVETLLSRAFPGTVRIGRVERATLGWVALRDVVVEDPSGRVVLRIAALEGEPNREAIARGAVAFRSVRARGVEARLIPSAGGRITLLDAFDDAGEPEPTARAGRPTEIRVDRIRIEQGSARLELEGMPLDFREVTAEGRVRSRENLDLVVERASLRLEREGAVVFRTRDLAGAYRTAPGARSELRALLFEGEDRVRVHVAMVEPREGAPDDAPPTIEAKVDLEPLTPRPVAALGQGALARDLPRAVRGRVEARGTSERAVFRAIVALAGANVRLDGMYTPRDTRGQLCVDRLALEALHRSLPAATVEGCARAGVGDLSAESFPARLELRGASVDGTRIPDLRLDGTVHAREEALVLRSLDLPRAEPRGEERLNVEGRVTRAGAIDLRLVARALRLDDDPALGALLGGTSGAVDGRGALRLVPDRSRIEASLDADVVEPRGVGVSARRLAFTARAEGSVDAPRLELRAWVRGLRAGGVELRRVRVDANGTPEAFVATLRGDVVAAGRAFVRLRGARTGSVLAVEGGGRFGEGPGAVRLRLRGLRVDPENDRAELRALRIAYREGRALVRGSLAEGAVDVRATIEAMPVDALARGLAPDAGIEGALSGTVRLGGTAEHPTAEADLRLDDADAEGIERGEAKLVARLGPGEASLRLEASARRRGSLELEASARFPADVALEDALRAGTYALAGGVSGEGLRARVHARWDRDGLLAAAAATDERGGLGAASLRSEATPRALGRELDPLRYAFEAKAQLFERTLAELPVRRPSGLSDALAVEGSLALVHRPRQPIKGEIHASLRGDFGPMAAPEDDCSGVGLVALRIDGKVAGDRARANLVADVKGARRAEAEVLAQLPLVRMLRGDARARIEDAEARGRLDALDLRTLPVLCEMGVGTIDGEIVARDLARETADVRLSLSMDHARLGPEAFFDVDADVHAREGRAKARLVMRSDVGGSAHVEAVLPFTFGRNGLSPALDRGEVYVRSRFDRLTLEPFAPISRFVRHQAGTLHGTLAVWGTRDDPIAEGELELRDATLVVPVLDQRLSELEARIRFTPHWVTIERLSARDLQGVVRMRGGARLDGIVPREASLELEADRFPIRQEGVVTALVDARATGKFAHPRVMTVGELRFEELAIRLPDEGRRDVQDLAENPDIVYVDAYPEGWTPPRDEEEAATEEEPTVVEEPLELHVDASEPFWVRRDDLAVRLAAELDLAVAPRKSSLTGEVKTLEGFVELVGTRFEIQEGEIQFVGGETIDPLLDITALANAGTDAEVRVNITGQLSSPVLGFADRSGQRLTAGDALRCISSDQCNAGASTQAETAAGAVALQQQAQGQLASVTAGLLSTVARAGFGDRVPRITVSAGRGFEDLTVRAGFQANRLIPELLRGIVKSLYIEGYVGTEAVAEDAGAAVHSTSTRATGGFVLEMRHPNRIVSRGRYEPPASWSWDMTWQP